MGAFLHPCPVSSKRGGNSCVHDNRQQKSKRELMLEEISQSHSYPKADQTMLEGNEFLVTAGMWLQAGSKLSQNGRKREVIQAF